jgi:hypothetical protein
MLKIKDNVDLKELEKYGFEDMSDIYGYYYREYKIMSPYFTEFIGIDIDRCIGAYENADDDIRRISAHDDESIKELIDDLINDGLVEKVEE